MQHTHKGTGIPLYISHPNFFSHTHTHINRLPVEPLPHVFPDECAESFIHRSTSQPQVPSLSTITNECYGILGPPNEAEGRGQSGGRGTEPNHYTEQHVYEDADKYNR